VKFQKGDFNAILVAGKSSRPQMVSGYRSIHADPRFGKGYEVMIFGLYHDKRVSPAHRWSVTHLLTGLKVSHFRTLADAKAFDRVDLG
jgi:hypothetical protein